MKVTEVINHRPWPLPKGPWVMAQSWDNLLFANWPVEPSLLRDLIPAPLALDLYEGMAWISIVPFEMNRIHARGVPPIPGTSDFPELNVRTYVSFDGKTGVFFFSLDAANRLAVAAARRFFHLPYFNAEMTVDKQPNDLIRYSSTRTHPDAPPARFIGSYRPVSEVFHSRPGTVEHWLTERYCLYASDPKGNLYRGDIHHLPWPLQHAEADIAENTVCDSLNLPLSDTKPLLYVSKSIDVVLWALQQVHTNR